MDRSLVKRLSVRSGAIAFVVLAMASPFIGPNPPEAKNMRRDRRQRMSFS